LSAPIIELKLIRVTGNLDAVTVRIEKTDRTVAGHHERLRTADDGNLAPLQNRMKLVDNVIRVDVDAEMVQLGQPLAAHMFRTLRQSLQSDVVMLLAVAEKSHPGLEVPRGHFQTENGLVKLFRFLEVGDVENKVTERAVRYNHFSTINRLLVECQVIRQHLESSLS